MSPDVVIIHRQSNVHRTKRGPSAVPSGRTLYPGRPNRITTPPCLPVKQKLNRVGFRFSPPLRESLGRPVHRQPVRRGVRNLIEKKVKELLATL